jgi:hypothetical protein
MYRAAQGDRYAAAGAPARLQALRIEGRRSVEQIVDKYGIECRPVRDLLVEYFSELAFVRALYEDIARWAADDPARWAPRVAAPPLQG